MVRSDGASWLKAAEVARVMNEKKLPGIRFDAITMPVDSLAGKFKGQTIPAIRFVITDRQTYRPVRTSLLLIEEIRKQHPADFAWRGSIDRLTGSDKVRLAIEAGQLGPLPLDKKLRAKKREPVSREVISLGHAHTRDLRAIRVERRLRKIDTA